MAGDAHDVGGQVFRRDLPAVALPQQWEQLAGDVGLSGLSIPVERDDVLAATVVVIVQIRHRRRHGHRRPAAGACGHGGDEEELPVGKRLPQSGAFQVDQSRIVEGPLAVKGAPGHADDRPVRGVGGQFRQWGHAVHGGVDGAPKVARHILLRAGVRGRVGQQLSPPPLQSVLIRGHRPGTVVLDPGLLPGEEVRQGGHRRPVLPAAGRCQGVARPTGQALPCAVVGIQPGHLVQGRELLRARAPEAPVVHGRFPGGLAGAHQGHDCHRGLDVEDVLLLACPAALAAQVHHPDLTGRPTGQIAQTHKGRAGQPRGRRDEGDDRLVPGVLLERLPDGPPPEIHVQVVQRGLGGEDHSLLLGGADHVVEQRVLAVPVLHPAAGAGGHPVIGRVADGHGDAPVPLDPAGRLGGLGEDPRVAE